MVEFFDQLVDAGGIEANRGQLKGKRNAVKAPAKLGHLPPIGLGDHKAGLRRRSAFSKQPDRLERQGRLPRPYRPVWHGQRWDAKPDLAFHGERLSAGREDLQGGALPQEHHEKAGAGIQHVFAFIEYEQHVPILEELRERGLSPPASSVAESNRAEHSLRKQLRVRNLTHVDYPDPVGEEPCELIGCPKGEPGLADSSRSSKGHQPVGSEEPRDLVQLLFAPDEAGQLDIWARTLSPDHSFDLTRAAVGALTSGSHAFAPHP